MSKRRKFNGFSKQPLNRQEANYIHQFRTEEYHPEDENLERSVD
jgi:hypothetical protein